MKTVLILTFTFPPNADGVSEAAKAMAEGLAERGWNIIVGTGFLSERVEFSPKPNITIRQFKVSGSENWRIGIRGQVREFQEFLLTSDPDFLVCHCWDMWPTSLAQQMFPLIRARKILVSHGYTTHLWQRASRFPWGLGYWFAAQHLTLQLPLALRLYDRVVVLSPKRDFSRFFDHLVALSTGYKRVRVIPNGTDLAAFDSAPADFRKMHQIGSGFLFLCVANYSPRKNQELALRAFHALRHGKAILCFIGSEFNDYARSLIALNEELGKNGNEGRVLFLENISRDQVLSAYKCSDAFILSAHAETQPIVLLECMAARKPFISTDTGCVRDLPGGLVVKNLVEMTNTMRRLIENPGLGSRLGAEGRAACEESYTWEKVMDSYHRMLLELEPHNSQ